LNPSLAAALAATAIMASNIQYIRSILSNETRPSVAAMLVFALSIGATLTSSAALGADLAILATLGVNLVFNVGALCLVLARRAGRMSFTRFEQYGLLAIVLSFIAWGLSGNPWIALLAPTTVDAIGLVMVIRKLAKDPGSEDVFAWLAVAVAYGISLSAVSRLSLENVLYAGVSLVLCGYIGCLTWCQRKRIQGLQG